ncbi:hypothetical protein [Haliangium sp.]|uniref:hypothetical protein n=1 Tax=Haliangium sp. TaxID=2663208 RepID=UPI003D0A9483
MTLQQLGMHCVHVLAQVARVGDGVCLEGAEVAIAYATADGSSTAPELRLGEGRRLGPAEAEVLLAELVQPVYVDRQALTRAPRHTVGCLRLVLSFTQGSASADAAEPRRASS